MIRFWLCFHLRRLLAQPFNLFNGVRPRLVNANERHIFYHLTETGVPALFMPIAHFIGDETEHRYYLW